MKLRSNIECATSYMMGKSTVNLQVSMGPVFPF